MSSDQQVTYLAILGFISTLPESDQEKIKECTDKIRAVFAEYPLHQWSLALSLIGAEMAKDIK